MCAGFYHTIIRPTSYNKNMIREISAKTLLSHVTQPDTWFGLKYNMNLYRGCQHQCIYCDSRSLCYRLENFSDILIKINALEILEKELAHKRVKGTIGTGSMNDPYMPIEAKTNLTGRALELIDRYSFPVHILTKSALVIRDLEILKRINRTLANVSFSITTSNDHLARIIEPGASSPTERFQAMKTLSSAGITTGVLMMPLLPFIEDNRENISEVILMAKENGASYILPSFGVTLRDRQRTYFYSKLDINFPGLRTKYEKTFGDRYFASIPEQDSLATYFRKLCIENRMPMRIPLFQPTSPQQLRML
jgi:DNA repair photolyase